MIDYHGRMHGDGCECSADFIRLPILAIEAEASAHGDDPRGDGCRVGCPVGIGGGMSAIVIRIPGAPPTPNANVRRVWQAKGRLAREWRATAALCVIAQTPGDQRGIDACTLDVLHVLPDRRRRDLDGLGSAIKPLLDGMVDAGLLVDDSATVIRAITHRAEVRKGIRETVLTVTPIEAAA